MFTAWRFITPYLLGALALQVLSCNQKDPVDFNLHVRPILNKNCLACHGGVKKSAGVSFLFEEEALQAGESGIPTIVPGSAKKSAMYQRIIHQDPDLRMPSEKESLSEREIETIKNWIDQGAKWGTHWAYNPPADIKASNLDTFIHAKHKMQGLHFSEAAEPAVWVRRASLDLIGMPPTPDQYEKWLSGDSFTRSDKLSILEELMDSPHFGERWAAWWLDLARYADSKGYEKDAPRDIWRFRDWVIRAFNEDMPLDSFTIRQLAGDQLPDATSNDRIATAFHRNTMTNTEGGTDDEEFRIAAVMDRVNTTFEVWQSTTMACVQCHSHPYDPFRHEEYYGLMAFFNTTQDFDLHLEHPNEVVYDSAYLEDIQNTVSYIQKLKGVEDSSKKPLHYQIQQALRPFLLPQDCDDFQNVLIYSNQHFTNWSNNVNAGTDRDYWILFKSFDLSDLKQVRASFATRGQDSRLDIHLDSKQGPLLASLDFPNTGSLGGQESAHSRDYQEETWPLLRSELGTHDLYLHFVNESRKAPDGIVMIKSLRFEAENPSKRLHQAQEKLLKLRQEHSDLTPIMKDQLAPFSRTTTVYERGSIFLPGDTVSPNVPAVLPNIMGESRMDLARWLVAKENPLTARVLANRIWEQLFGRGIVTSLEDFGTQGEPPTHPELLDYLALQLQNKHQWSLKSFLLEIMTSQTYGQTSQASPELLEKDPDNSFYARGPRFRLSGEQVRDQALAVSGLLNPTLGGPSVMPYQPDGVWQVVYSGLKWEAESEEEFHRRGLYTYWRRTSPYPSMVAFDNPSREFCVSRRIRTNTPLQALVTLNDPVYVEISNALADRMEGTSVSDAIRNGYFTLFGTDPPPDVVETLQQVYHAAESTEVEFQEEDGFDSPLSVVANVMINLDAFLTKE